MTGKIQRRSALVKLAKTTHAIGIGLHCQLWCLCRDAEDWAEPGHKQEHSRNMAPGKAPGGLSVRRATL
jgi:hypothetical protein